MPFFTEIYPTITAQYHKSWFKFLLSRTALGQLLERNEQDPCIFFSTYFNSWSLNKFWFRLFVPANLRGVFDRLIYFLNGLEERERSELSLGINLIFKLEARNLLQEDNVNIAFDVLKGKLKDTDFIRICSIEEKGAVVKQILTILEKILGWVGRDSFFDNISGYSRLFESQRTDVLINKYVDAIPELAHADSIKEQLKADKAVSNVHKKEYVHMLSLLEKNGLLNEQAIRIILKHPPHNKDSLLRLIDHMDTLGFLNGSMPTLELIQKKSNCLDWCFNIVGGVPDKLKATLTKEDFDEISSYGLTNEDYSRRLSESEEKQECENIPDPNKCARLFRTINRLSMSDIGTDDNKRRIKKLFAEREAAFCESIFTTIAHLSISRILNQDTFDKLLSPEYTILLTPQAGNIVWARIPVDGPPLSLDNYNDLLHAARRIGDTGEERTAEEKLRSIEAVVHGILTPAAPPEEKLYEPGSKLNPAQSTHTASVHESVSACATILKEMYSPGFKVEEKIKQVEKWANELKTEDLFKDQVVKTCISRFLNSSMKFTDVKSNISLRQLLAWVYCAIQDRAKLEKTGCTPEAAEKAFIDGLYEIQRGYNIDEAGKDDKAEDRPICTSGSFNKLIQTLQGVHPDIHIKVINAETIYVKGQIVAQEVAIQYLDELASSKTEEVQTLLGRLKKDKTFEPIWPAIKEKVIMELSKEFIEAGTNNKVVKKYIEDFASSASYLGLDLEHIQKSLSTKSIRPRM